MKLVYVAGRYRANSPDLIELNRKAAEYTGWLVRELGHFPVIPHLNTPGWENYETLKDGEWVAGENFYLIGTLELCRRCDALILVQGWEKSAGARAEATEMRKLGRPVFFDIESLRRWLKETLKGELAQDGVPQEHD